MKIRSSTGKEYELNSCQIQYSEFFTHLMGFNASPHQIFLQNVPENVQSPSILSTYFPATFEEFNAKRNTIRQELEFWCEAKSALYSDYDSKVFLEAFDMIKEPCINIKCVSVTGLDFAVKFIQAAASSNLTTESFTKLPSIFRNYNLKKQPLSLIIKNTPFAALSPLLQNVKRKEMVLVALRAACVLRIKAMTLFYSCVLSKYLAGLTVLELQKFLKVPPQYKKSVASKLEGLTNVQQWIQTL